MGKICKVLQLFANGTPPAAVREKGSPADAVALVSEMLECYRLSRCRGSVSSRNKAAVDAAVVAEFFEFCGKYPWVCNEDDLDAWMALEPHKRGAQAAKQPRPQGRVRDFYACIMGAQRLANKALLLFGANPGDYIYGERLSSRSSKGDY